MTTIQNHDPVAHKLHSLCLTIVVNLDAGYSAVQAVSGHSRTTKGCLFYIGTPTDIVMHDEEPSHLSIVTLDAYSLLDELVTHRPNTEARASFVLAGGLQGHGMDPLF